MSNNDKKILQQIRLHSDYSILDSTMFVWEAVWKSEELGSSAIGITDFNAMGGLVELTRECNSDGLKQIYGTETILTKILDIEKLENESDDLFEKNKKINKEINKLKRKKNDDNELEISSLEAQMEENEKRIDEIDEILEDEIKYRSKIAFISKTWKGYTNLCGINNISQRFGNVDGDGRIDYESLLTKKDDLFVIIDGLHGFLVRYIINGKKKEAEELLLKFKEDFGESLYVEFQPHMHRHIAMSSKTVYELCKKHDINILINNAPRILEKFDVMARKTMICKKHNKKYSNVDTLELTNPEILDSPYIETYYIMEREELFEFSKKMFGGFMSEDEINQYIDSNNIIADKCEEYELRSSLRLPKYEYCDEGMTESEYLRKVTYEELERYAERKEYVRENLESYKELLEEELEVIDILGFPGYFLIMRHIIKKAKEIDFVGPGRGSAAGSLTTLLCNITSNIDPIQENLMFERFLSLGRAKGLEYHVMSIKRFDREKDRIQTFIANKNLIGGGWDPAGKFGELKSFEEIFENELKEAGINFEDITFEEAEKYIRKELKGNKYIDKIEDEFKILIGSKQKDVEMFYIMHKLGLKAYNKTNSYIANELRIVTNHVKEPYELQICSTRDIPDIDTDFKTVEGDDVIYNMIREDFGEDRVERVGTYQKLKVNSLLREMLRCLDVPPFTVNDLMKGVDLDELFDVELDDDNGINISKENKDKIKNIITEQNEELYDYLNKYDFVFRTLYSLLNKKSSVGKHAGGILISDIPLGEFIPLMGKSKDSLGTGYIESFSSKDMVYAGGIKFDILKLKTLNILESTCRKAGIDKLDLYNIGPDDYRSDFANKMHNEIIGKGLYSGLFQIGDNNSARFVADKMLKETFEAGENITFNELSLMSAANRPAAIGAELKDSDGDTIKGAHELFSRIKSGLIKENYFLSKVFERLTKNSLGMILYEEQTMLLSSMLCGYTETEASDLRKSFKKLRKLGGRYTDDGAKFFDKIYNKFLEGAKHDKYIVKQDGKTYIGSNKRLDFLQEKKGVKFENRELFEKGMSDELGRKLTDLVMLFSEYGFNKAHADSYALVTHWTVRLKYHYPVTYMSVILDYQGINMNMAKDLEMQGIKLVGADINKSKGLMSPDEEEKKIYWGLDNVKGAGSASYYLEKGIECFGEIKSMEEINIFIEKKNFGKRAIQPMIQIGSFDKLYKNRKKLETYYLEGGLMNSLYDIEAEYKEDFTDEIGKKYQRIFKNLEYDIDDFKEEMNYEKILEEIKKGEEDGYISISNIETKDIDYELLNDEGENKDEDALFDELPTKLKRALKKIDIIESCNFLESKRDIISIDRKNVEIKLKEQRKFEKEYLGGKTIDEYKLPEFPSSFELNSDMNVDEIDELFRKIRLGEDTGLGKDKEKELKEDLDQFYREIDEMRKLEKYVYENVVENIEDYGNKEIRELEEEICGMAFTEKFLTPQQKNLCDFVMENIDDGYIGGEIVHVHEHIDKRGGLMAWIDIENGSEYWERIVCFAGNYGAIKDKIYEGNFICFVNDPRFGKSMGRKILEFTDDLFVGNKPNIEEDQEELETRTSDLGFTVEEINETMISKKERLDKKDRLNKFENLYFKVNDVKKIKDKKTRKVIYIIECYYSQDGKEFDRGEFYIAENKINIIGKKMKVGRKGVAKGYFKFSVKLRKTYYIVEDISLSYDD